MAITMLGIDYKDAPLSLRERFSLTPGGAVRVGMLLRERCNCDGVVVLSTCNRTEIWCSNPRASLSASYFSEMGLSQSEADCSCFHVREDDDAVRHLLELSCGMQSQIFGEDQILSQVKESLRIAREAELTDPILETLFRTALTAAKQVKTEVSLSGKDRSVPQHAITCLEAQFGSLSGKRCLVIGNGEMGRLLCRLLREKGCEVALTIRKYHHHDTIVPDGCVPIPYDSRYEAMAQAEFVFSATISPHCTVQREELLKHSVHSPLVLVDLAVPRDIDPALAELSDIILYDMDTLGITLNCDEAALQAAEVILSQAAAEFYRWLHTRDGALSVHRVGQAVSSLATEKLTQVYRTQFGASAPQVAKAVEKSVEKLLYDLRQRLPMEDWQACVEVLSQTVSDWEEEV